MAESSPYPTPGSDDTAADMGANRTTGPPRWVKVFGIIALVVVVLLGALLVAGGGPGGHGPGRHSGGQAPASNVVEPDRVGGDDHRHRA